MPAADASADAIASAKAFFEDFKKGRRHVPTEAECDAAASASATAISFGDFYTFSAARAAADASGEVRGSQGWRDKFSAECKAKASAEAVSVSSGDGQASAGRQRLQGRHCQCMMQ